MTTILFLVGVIVFGIAVLVIIGMIGKKVPGRLNQKQFHEHWLELLARVKTPEGMVLAVIDADKLLDDALRRRHFKGKTVGERLVSAQRELTDNDSIWFAHKLRNRLVHEPRIKLKKRECQTALAGYRQALRDLGAL